MKKKMIAFTLAEVLITLGIIGVVAALTIPTLVANYQAKSWNTAADVFEKRLTEAVKTMNVQGKLGSYGGYSTTEGFVQELQKHLKIAKVCDKDHLMECFEDKIVMNSEEIDLTKIKTSKNFGQNDWGTNIVGLQIANGTSALIAYNPKCKANPYDNDITGSDCYAIVYDTSGYSSPNELSKDLRKSASVLNIKGQMCAFELDGTCFTAPFTPRSISKEECLELQKEGKYKINGNCSYDPDYWLGAVVDCGGNEHLTSAKDLANLANKLYNVSSVGAVEDVSSLKFDSSVASTLGLPDAGFMLWADITMAGSYLQPIYREFNSGSTIWRQGMNQSRRGNSAIKAMCKL